MSTLLVAAIVIALTVIPPFLFIRFGRRRKRLHYELLYARFKKTGDRHGLLFSHHQVLKDKIVGYDAQQQVLLLFATDSVHKGVVVDLANRRSSSVCKEYSSINISGNKEGKTEQVLNRIVLRIEFENGAVPVEIAFYDSQVNGIYEMPELETKAKAWERLLQTAAKTAEHA